MTVSYPTRFHCLRSSLAFLSHADRLVGVSPDWPCSRSLGYSQRRPRTLITLDHRWTAAGSPHLLSITTLLGKIGDSRTWLTERERLFSALAPHSSATPAAASLSVNKVEVPAFWIDWDGSIMILAHTGSALLKAITDTSDAFAVSLTEGIPPVERLDYLRGMRTANV